MKITDGMKRISTGEVFRGVFQQPPLWRFIKGKSFYDMTLYCLQEKKDYINQIFKG